MQDRVRREMGASDPASLPACELTVSVTFSFTSKNVRLSHKDHSHTAHIALSRESVHSVTAWSYPRHV